MNRSAKNYPLRTHHEDNFVSLRSLTNWKKWLQNHLEKKLGVCQFLTSLKLWSTSNAIWNENGHEYLSKQFKELYDERSIDWLTVNYFKNSMTKWCCKIEEYNFVRNDSIYDGWSEDSNFILRGCADVCTVTKKTLIDSVTIPQTSQQDSVADISLTSPLI